MISANSAIRMMEYLKPEEKVTNVLEFPSFYLFMLRPKEIDNMSPYYTGTVFDAIQKSDGKWFQYDITSDIDAYLNAKEIKT